MFARRRRRRNCRSKRRRRRWCKKSESPAADDAPAASRARPLCVRRTEYILVTAIMNLQFGSQRAKKERCSLRPSSAAEDEYYAKFAGARGAGKNV